MQFLDNVYSDSKNLIRFPVTIRESAEPAYYFEATKW